MGRNIFSAVQAVLAAGFFGFGCASKPVPTLPVVDNFELERYLGKWYEIARLPNYFEDGLSEVTAEYTRHPDGTIEVVNRGRKAGKVRQISGRVRLDAAFPGTGALEVSFFLPFYQPYRIVKLADDYRFSVVTGATAKYLWVLSRTPKLSEADGREIASFLRTAGIDGTQLIFSGGQSALPDLE